MLIAGVDEVGRGPLAGPVCAAAVVFRKGYRNKNIKDSKQLSALKRETVVGEILRDAVSWAVVSVGHHRITALNIREASREAMRLAVRRIKADRVLVDGNVPILGCPFPQETIVGGDALRVEIGAASILAKVWRDWLMTVLDERYPGYHFSTHAGYATERHRGAVEDLGPCPIHRRTFSGVKEFWPPRTQEDCSQDQVTPQASVGSCRRITRMPFPLSSGLRDLVSKLAMSVG